MKSRNWLFFSLELKILLFDLFSLIHNLTNSLSDSLLMGFLLSFKNFGASIFCKGSSIVLLIDVGEEFRYPFFGILLDFSSILIMGSFVGPIRSLTFVDLFTEVKVGTIFSVLVLVEETSVIFTKLGDLLSSLFKGLLLFLLKLPDILRGSLFI